MNHPIAWPQISVQRLGRLGSLSLPLARLRTLPSKYLAVSDQMKLRLSVDGKVPASTKCPFNECRLGIDVVFLPLLLPQLGQPPDLPRYQHGWLARLA